MNLLQETTDALTACGKTWDDVLWIGDYEYTISIEDFKRLADHTYDNGYGSQEVNPDLKVVGEDWWLERFEYDGAECWVYKAYPVKPLAQKDYFFWNQQRIIGHF